MAKAHHVTSDVLTDIDYQLLFESVPGLYLVLSPNFEIKAASNAYLRDDDETRRGSRAINFRGVSR